MKLREKVAAWILCLSLLAGITGCGQETAPAPEATGTTGKTVTVMPREEVEALYTAAVEPVKAASALTLTTSRRESRYIGEGIYDRKCEAVAVYTGLGTDSMEAQITEALSGNYSAQFVSFYSDGMAYSQFNGCSFVSETTQEAYLREQVPAVLLDASLYTALAAEQTESGTVITFSGAVGPEDWTGISEEAELQTADGTAVLDLSGNLVSSSYYAEYILGNVTYVLEVTSELGGTAETLTRPGEEECVRLADDRVPKWILQVVQDVYSAPAFTGNISERMYCQAVSVVRSEKVTVSSWGTGEDFLANVTDVVTLTDFTNTETVNTLLQTFRDGTFLFSANGGESQNSGEVTQERMRAYCEDLLLEHLMTPDFLAGASVTDTGDYLYIEFTGNEALAESVCDEIYRMVNVDMDSYSSSYTDGEISGYLTLCKQTGLPTALGLYVSRDHVRDNVTYATTYQLDQSLDFSADAAYSAITGELPAEETAASDITPVLYQVTGPEGETLWLFGTIHLGDERSGALPEEIRNAFDAADALAVEYDPEAFETLVAEDSSLRSQLAQLYYYSDGSRLQTHLGEELYEQARILMLAAGENSNSMPYMRAFLWENKLNNFFLGQSSSLQTQKGVDVRLLSLARQQGKSILEIEGGLAQIQALASCSEALQVLLLRQTVSTSLAEYRTSAQTLYERWCSGNPEAIEEALAQDTDGCTAEELALWEEYDRNLIQNRNSTMLTAAQSYLESGQTVFMAVGIAHVLGENGLAEELEALGYTVETVVYSEK